MKIAVLGAGSWGTALSHLLGGKGHVVRLWGRDAAVISHINDHHHNPRYLREAILPESVEATTDASVALRDAEACVLAVPCAAAEEVLGLAKPSLSSDCLLLNAAKGLVPDRDLLVSQVAEEMIPEWLPARFAVMSGPNLAREMVEKIPTATVIASANQETACALQDAFCTGYLRVYTSDDVVGVELAGALKNVIAVGAGISDGLGYGDNTKAALVTRGLAEMVRLGVALGGNPRTFSGLSGVGDLLATCVSSQSRNWTVGNHLANGERLEDILASMGMVAEGVPTARSAYRIAKRMEVDMPVLEQVHAVLFEDKPCGQAVMELMSRQAGPEIR